MWKKLSAQVRKAGRDTFAVTWVAIRPTLRRLSDTLSVCPPSGRKFVLLFQMLPRIYLKNEQYALIFAFNNKQVTFSVLCCLGIGKKWHCESVHL